MKKLIGGILMLVGIVHACGCIIEGRFALIIVSAAIAATGAFLFFKRTEKKA
jgi:hypothetical protein